MTSSGAQQDADVIVVGGRVGGAVTAALFAQQGLRVVVLDRATFPSATLSTHFFRGAVLVRVLARAGLLDSVLELGAPRLTREYTYVGGDDEPDVQPAQYPGAFGGCLSVRRETLDGTLVQQIRDSGVEVRTSTSVAGLIRAAGRVTGVVLADGSTLRAPLVVGADGRRSMVAAGVDAEVIESSPGVRGCYYRYVRDYASPTSETPDGAEFSFLGDQLAYAFPSDDAVTCIALSVNLADYAVIRHDARAVFDAVIGHHRGIQPRYAASTPAGRVFGSGPQLDVVRRPAGPGWALVGDAALHQDPWSGEGMDAAGVAAELLVDAYVASGGADSWQDAYASARDDALLDDFHHTVTCASDLAVLSGVG
jgi:flavin-dependent dehydrogenase